MKKLFFFATLIAATTFGLTSCSDSNGGDSPNGGDGEGQTAYLAVRLSNVGSVPGLGSKPFTRQSTYNYNTNVTSGKYLNGTDEEGNVSSVRFYLFDAQGEPYYLAGTRQNFLDENVSSTSEIENDPTTIERKTGVVLVIRGESQALPARIAAVANPTSISTDVLKDVMSVDDLQKALTSVYSTKNTSGTPASFLMTNSVYLNKEGTETTDKAITSTLIDDSKFQKTETEAEKENNAVQIYVERVAARVDVNKGTSSNWTTEELISGLTTKPATNKDVYTLTEDDDKSVSTSSTSGATLVSIPQIYVVVDGWGLADENGQAYVEKNLATSYTNLGNTDESPLSTKDYHRSFWETSAQYTPIRYNFNNYINLAAGATDALGHTVTATEAAKNCGKDLEGKTYTLPNTPTTTYSWNDLNRRFSADNNQSPTKVVVAAHLAYVNGGKLEPAEICSYRGRTYITEAYVKSLIVTDVNTSTANNIYIKSTDDEGNTTYTSLTVNDFTFEPTDNPGTENSYKLTPTLKLQDNNGKDITFAKKTGVDADNNPQYADYTDAAAAQTALKNITGTDITIYKAGQTYYYTTLHHIWYDNSITDNDTKQTNIGAWGVVRNHLYKVTLASIKGWGTPVYDATKDIIPVTPKDDKSYLGAQINVLQWRVVEQEANIDGTVSHVTK